MQWFKSLLWSSWFLRDKIPDAYDIALQFASLLSISSTSSNSSELELCAKIASIAFLPSCESTWFQCKWRIGQKVIKGNSIQLYHWWRCSQEYRSTYKDLVDAPCDRQAAGYWDLRTMNKIYVAFCRDLIQPVLFLVEYLQSLQTFLHGSEKSVFKGIQVGHG